MAGALLTNASRGDLTSMGYENSSCALPTPDPYGTALDLSTYTDAKICAQVTPNFVSEEVDFDTIGCGGTSGFGTDCAVENREYRVSLSGDLGFQNGFDRLLAQYFGESSVPAEQTALEGDYKHVLTFSSNPNGHFGTFAYESSKSTVIELKSTYVESLSIVMANVGQPIRYTFDLAASDAEFDTTSAVNDNAALDALAFVDGEKPVPKCENKFRIAPMLDDGADVALTDNEVRAITSFDFSTDLPLEVIPEMTGGDCNAPTQSDKRSGTLTIDLKLHEGNDDFSYQDWIAGTFFQADVEWLGNIIGAGELKSFKLKFPKLCLVEPPVYNVTEPGFNSYTMVFRVVDSNNILPDYSTTAVEAEFINQRVGIYLEV
jgi:hypothetical protein